VAVAAAADELPAVDPADVPAVTAISPAPPAPKEVQGLIVRGYGKSVAYKRHRIFTIASVPGAKSFLAALLPKGAGPLQISDAELLAPGELTYRLNLGITYNGFAQLDPALCAQVDAGTQQIFTPFKRGAYASSTAQTVRDIGASDPSQWWGARAPSTGTPPSNESLHLVVSLYANTPELRDALSVQLDTMIPGAGTPNAALTQAFTVDSDPLDDRDVSIHFGYGDGFSQPFIEDWNTPNEGDDRPPVPAFRFVIAPNAAGYKAHEFLYNGTFAAFRMLYQDVGAFEAYLTQNPRPELLAAKMCGRWRDGTPIVVSPDGEDSSLHGFDLTNFQYLNPSANQKGPRLPDPDGEMCPYAAHIRRANPRDDTKVHFNDDDAALHRVVRRANPYGPIYSPDTADTPRGLVGYFIGADLVNQFEFVMGTWIGRSNSRSPYDASPDQSGVDPMFGPKDEYDWPNFYYPDGDDAYLGADGKPWEPGTAQSLANFIRTDGAMYVFLPSISAIGRLAATA
jgi:hypothetical protein